VEATVNDGRRTVQKIPRPVQKLRNELSQKKSPHFPALRDQLRCFENLITKRLFQNVVSMLTKATLTVYIERPHTIHKLPKTETDHCSRSTMLKSGMPSSLETVVYGAIATGCKFTAICHVPCPSKLTFPSQKSFRSYDILSQPDLFSLCCAIQWFSTFSL
jgi:hypothetical protein